MKMVVCLVLSAKFGRRRIRRAIQSIESTTSKLLSLSVCDANLPNRISAQIGKALIKKPRTRILQNITRFLFSRDSLGARCTCHISSNSNHGDDNC